MLTYIPTIHKIWCEAKKKKKQMDLWNLVDVSSKKKNM